MATMLDCKKIQTDLSEYVDGTLDNDRAWTIKMHLSSCAVCDQIVRDFSATARLVGSLPQREPSINFEAALAKRLADQALAPRKSAPLWNRALDVFGSLRLRPAVLAPGLALAALTPVAFFAFTHQTHQGASSPTVALATPSAVDASKDPRDTTLDELLNDHVAYAASEPLGDPSGMLSARTSGGSVSPADRPL